MSKPPPTKPKRHFLQVTPHTLHAVRTAGRTVEFWAECALAETSRLQGLLQEWSEGEAVAAIAAVAPQPMRWHLANAEESQRLSSRRAVQQFATRFSFGLQDPLEVIGCTAESGQPVTPQNDRPWLLGVTSGAGLASAAAEVIGRGVVTTALGSATLCHLAAVRTSLAVQPGPTVHLWEIGRKQSHVFTVGIQGVEAVTTCPVGFETILAAAESAFGIRTPTEAAKRFFGDLPADPALVTRFAEMLGPQLESTLRAAPPVTGSTAFACSGLTSRQDWFAQGMAAALGLPWWRPDAGAYLSRLQLRLPLAAEETPSIAMLGALHLAASPHHEGGAWHPTWGDISRPVPGALATAEEDRTKKTPAPSSHATPSAAATDIVPVRHVPLATAAVAEPALAAPQPTAEASSRIENRRAPEPAPLETGKSTPPPLPRPTGRAEPPAEAGIAPTLARTDRLAVTPGPQTPAGPGAGNSPTKPVSVGTTAPMPPREPVVIVVRKRGYWLHVGIIVALLGAALAWKFYLDGEASQAAAEQARVTAAEAIARADREKAAADEQTRRVAEQVEQAEKRARAQAEANATSNRQIQQQAEATRQAELAQARREAEEQTRKRLESALAATAPGHLKLNTQPTGAEVHVNDRSVGRAPVAIDDLTPGRHVVKLTLAGYLPREVSVDVAGAKVADLGVIQLERARGSAAVSSMPAGIDFSIRPIDTKTGDGSPRRGRTPARIDDLAVGTYLVHFNRPGWPERTERLTVDHGTVTRAATTFAGGTVTINSEPPGAVVRQNGLELGSTPLTLTDVPPGEADYELTHPEHEPLKLTGNVIAERELQLKGQLLSLDRLVSESELRIPPRPYITTPLDLGRLPRSTPPYIKVSFVVLRDGSLYDIDILDKLDRKIRQRSIEAIAKWKYYPGVSQAGYPVNVRITIPVKLARG